MFISRLFHLSRILSEPLMNANRTLMKYEENREENGERITLELQTPAQFCRSDHVRTELTSALH
jgi:hypothetical protein